MAHRDIMIHIAGIRLTNFVTAVVILGLASSSAAQRSANPKFQFEKQIAPYLKKYCYSCHSGSDADGDLRLDQLGIDFATEMSAEHWLEVVDKIKSGAMPPESEKKRPSAADSAKIVQWLTDRIDEAQAGRLSRRQNVAFYRLSREEYANSIDDLLGVRVSSAYTNGLNVDEQWQGFRRIGSVLSLSPSHLEKYLALAEQILSEAFPDTPPKPVHWKFDAVALGGGPRVYGKKILDELKSTGRANKIRADLWPGQKIRINQSHVVVENPGIYQIRVRLSGIRSKAVWAPHLVVAAENLDRILFQSDVDTAESRPTQISFSTHLPAGRHRITISNRARGPDILARMNRSTRRPFFDLENGELPWQLQLVNSDRTPIYPCLILDSVEIQGPIVDQTAAQKRNRFSTWSDRDPSNDCDGIKRFAQLAFRRPLKKNEFTKFEALYQREIDRGKSPRKAARTVMTAILCTKDFLFLIEGSPQTKTKFLNNDELASRLSYFLWSTMPDQELRNLARQKKLSKPKILRQQVVRMLADKRSRRFTNSFAEQWLQLERVGQFPPDSELYPEYDDYLEQSMVRESTEFFDRTLRQKLSIKEFLDSDWTMLNERLAKFYRIDGVRGDRFRSVKLQPKNQRGGILTQAAVLSATSDGLRHRPVHRGVWLLESIFAENIPAPPPNVEPIEPNGLNVKKSTLREKLMAHQNNETCSICHRRIDPLGHAFDNYDAIGRWRIKEIVRTGVGENPIVDASGKLPNGKRWQTPQQFKKILLDDIDRFNRAFVKKLATYALRRAINVDDRKSLDRIARASKVANYRLEEIVIELVTSDLFRKR